LLGIINEFRDNPAPMNKSLLFFVEVVFKDRLSLWEVEFPEVISHEVINES
jgi:hypothetical protein